MKTLHYIDWMKIIKFIGWVCSAIAGGALGAQI